MHKIRGGDPNFMSVNFLIYQINYALLALEVKAQNSDGRRSNMHIKAPIVSKPLGESEIPGGGFGWNNRHHGTDGPVKCEFCGTNHPERKDQSYTVDKVLGLQLIEECCGKAIDILYEELAEDFTDTYLEEFAKNPTDLRFCFFLDKLSKVLETAAKKVNETSAGISKNKEVLSKIGKSV